MTRFENGMVSYDDDRYDGLTLAELFADPGFSGYYELNGDETVEVDSGNGWFAADRNYVVRSGDHVKFSLATGVKGQ